MLQTAVFSPVKINVINGILKGDLDLLPHHGRGSLGRDGYTTSGNGNGCGGGS